MTNQETSSDKAADLRRRAEEAVPKTVALTSENLTTLSSEETLAMIHELRVHQIELEAQNEELRRMQAELETARGRYFNLYNLAQVGYLQPYELRMVKKDGAQVWVQLAASAAQDVDGAPVCRIVLSDMSEHKRVEEALRASEKRYRSLVDSSPETTFYISRDMHVSLCNQRAAGLYGVENPIQGASHDQPQHPDRR